MHRLAELIKKAECAEIDCQSIDDVTLADLSRQWAKEIRSEASSRYVNLSAYPPEDEPVSIFMAGAPGAGKTEIRRHLEKSPAAPILHLDPDDFRGLFPCYCGSNSSVFQGGVSLLMERILDRAFNKGVSFCLDGTLSSVEVAMKNIRRCLSKGRLILILFIHQEPIRSWEFAQAREEVEGRKITGDTFISQYHGCASVVSKILAEPEFDAARRENKLNVDVLVRSKTRKSPKWYRRIDTHQFKGLVKDQLSAEELRAIIGVVG